MHRSPAHPPAVRASAAGLTLLVHGLFMLLLMLEERMPQRPLPPSRRLAGLWIHLPAPGDGASLEQQSAVPMTPPKVIERVAAPVSTLPAPRPSTAITLPPPNQGGPTAPGPGTVDWRTEAAKHAIRAADAIESPPTFSPPPNVMHKPCTPRESSFEWKDKPPKDEPAVNPLLPPTDSVKLGGARVGVVAISIPLFAPKAEPNKHLFDDMKAGKTPYSSVPDPNYCD